MYLFVCFIFCYLNIYYCYYYHYYYYYHYCDYYFYYLLIYYNSLIIINYIITIITIIQYHHYYSLLYHQLSLYIYIVSAPSPSGGRVFASPFARLTAGKDNIDITSVSGTGHGQRIIAADVRDFQGN